MDRVINVALAELCEPVNLQTGLDLDPALRTAIEAFRILYRAGYVFRQPDVEQWALAHGWSPLAAIGLGDIAQGVNEGRAFHSRSKGPAYPHGTLETWEKLARGSA
jgi:hypothetical protein